MTSLKLYIFLKGFCGSYLQYSESKWAEKEESKCSKSPKVCNQTLDCCYKVQYKGLTLPLHNTVVAG